MYSFSLSSHISLHHSDLYIHQHSLENIYNQRWDITKILLYSISFGNWRPLTLNPTTTNAAIPTKSSITKVSSSKLFHCLIGFNSTFFFRGASNSTCCEIPRSISHQWKTKMCRAKDSGNLRSKCIKATTYTRAKTMTQTLAKHRDKQA